MTTITTDNTSWTGHTFEGYCAEAFADQAVAQLFAGRSHCELTFTFEGAALDTFAVAVEAPVARRAVDDELRAWEQEMGIRSSFTRASCPWRIIRAEGGRYIVGRA